jgi:hypothetical protein
MEMGGDVGHCCPAESKVALLCYQNNATVVGMGYCRPPQGLPNNKTSTFGAQAPTQPVDFELANVRRRLSDGSVTSLPIRAASRFTVHLDEDHGHEAMAVARQVRPTE